MGTNPAADEGPAWALDPVNLRGDRRGDDWRADAGDRSCWCALPMAAFTFATRLGRSSIFAHLSF